MNWQYIFIGFVILMALGFVYVIIDMKEEISFRNQIIKEQNNLLSIRLNSINNLWNEINQCRAKPK